MGFLLYILLVMVICVIVSLLRISFTVDYNRKGQDDNLVVRMSLLQGLIRYKTEVPTIELEQRFFTPALKMAGELEKAALHPIQDKELRLGMPITLELISSLPGMLRAGWERFQRYNSALYYLFRFVRCRRFYWRTEVGFHDAACTGMMVGVLWGIKSFLYNNFRAKIGVMAEKPAILVVPDYFHKKLALDFYCIFDIRIGHIIIAGLNFVRCGMKRV